MVNYIWNGSNGNFDTAADWSPNGVPGTYDIAEIPTGVVYFTESVLSTEIIQLGSTSSAGTLDFSGGNAGYTLLNNVIIDTYSTGSPPSAINVTGELELAEAYEVPQVSITQSLDMTLTPGGTDGVGIFALDPGAILTFGVPLPDGDGGSIAGTVSITPDTAADADKVALVNDSEVEMASGGTFLIDVPVYAQAGQLGTLNNDGGTLELGSSVAGQIVDIGYGGSLILDRPSAFDAALAPAEQISSTGTGYYELPLTLSSGTSIDLRGLAADRVAFVTTPQMTNDIELLNGSNVVDTLYLQSGLIGALGLSTASDGDGGTILHVDLSSDSAEVFYGTGDAVLDANALLLSGPHTDYAVVQGSNAATISTASLTDFTTPQATLCFTDGTEIFNTNTTAAAVDRLYEGILGRDADSGGLLYWSNLAAYQTASLSQIATEILQSPEFGSKMDVSDTGFVDQLYANVLGRPADAGGQSYWTNLLANGEDRGAVAAAFTSSYEAISEDASRLAQGVFLAN
jgi:hypothetical protein